MTTNESDSTMMKVCATHFFASEARVNDTIYTWLEESVRSAAALERCTRHQSRLCRPSRLVLTILLLITISSSLCRTAKAFSCPSLASRSQEKKCACNYLVIVVEKYTQIFPLAVRTTQGPSCIGIHLVPLKVFN
jgi:hypothetical protein